MVQWEGSEEAGDGPMIRPFDREGRGTAGGDRAEDWERRMEWPLTVGALAYLVAYAYPILEPSMDPTLQRATTAVTALVWAAFAVDYAARLMLSRDRWKFVRTNLFDLAVVVLPMFRPLRLLRLLTALSVLNRYAGSSLRGRVAVYAAGGITLALVISALAMLDAERGVPGSNIESFGDALWWSFATVTTVGYGDQFPVTMAGRLIATALMLTGIALLGVITASFATWMIERVEEIDEESQTATRRDIRDLREEVRRLHQQLGEVGAPPDRQS